MVMRRMSSASLYSSRAYKLPEAQIWNCQCAAKAKAELLPHADCSTTRGILCQAENADFLKGPSLSFGQEETTMRNVLVSTLKASAVMLCVIFQCVTDSTVLRCMARTLWGLLACQVFHQQRWERMTCRLWWWHSQCSGWQYFHSADEILPTKGALKFGILFWKTFNVRKLYKLQIVSVIMHQAFFLSFF